MITLKFYSKDGKKFLGERRYRVPSKGLIIGRGSEADVRLSDRQSSSQHSIIYYRNGNYYIRDLGSRNGTYVNGEKVIEKVIVGGDIIVIGDYKIVFEVLSREFSWDDLKVIIGLSVLIGIAIILIPGLIGVPAYRNMQIRAKKARVQEDLRNIATALEAFYVDWNQYPAASNWQDELTGGLGATINIPSNTTATGETGGITYIDSIPSDPFNPGKGYHYTVSIDGSQYWVWSVGSNGIDNNHSMDDIVRTNTE